MQSELQQTGCLGLWCWAYSTNSWCIYWERSPATPSPSNLCCNVRRFISDQIYLSLNSTHWKLAVLTWKTWIWMWLGRFVQFLFLPAPISFFVAEQRVKGSSITLWLFPTSLSLPTRHKVIRRLCDVGLDPVQFTPRTSLCPCTHILEQLIPIFAWLR